LLILYKTDKTVWQRVPENELANGLLTFLCS